MPFERVEIDLAESGARSRVRIGGRDWYSIRTLDIHAGINDLTTVTIEFLGTVGGMVPAPYPLPPDPFAVPLYRSS